MLKNHILLVDVETANDLTDPLVYDLGLVVLAPNGDIVESYSLVISDIFNNTVLMDSAYYANKYDLYLEDMRAGLAHKVNFYTARQLVLRLMKEYGITDVYAYNCDFDRKALTQTYRYLTKSKFRWFFPYGTQYHCIWHIACQTIGSEMDYYNFCIKNGYYKPSGNITTDAETMYRYLTQDKTFKEEHTGLADCLIEREILMESFARAEENGIEVKTHINRLCWRIPQRPDPGRPAKRRKAKRE